MPGTLDERLEQWEEAQQRGEPLALDALCADWPEGRAELARCIRLLQTCDRLLALDEHDADQAHSARGAAGPNSSTGPAVIAGYEVRGVLGRGGMGIVYRAWDPVLDREVALKTLAPALPVPPEEAERLQRRFELERQVLAQFRHDNTVPIYAGGVHEGQPYFVMECIAGGSLVECLSALTTAGPAQIVPFVEAVARAVAYAHDRGILHRDLKPGNILLDGDGRPRVTDFGLAKLFAVDDEATTEVAPTSDPSDPPAAGPLTAAGFQPGTPAYMAPEQFDPTQGSIGRATDIWAIGVILYELLTGTKPFGTGSRAVVAPRVLLAPLPRLRGVPPRLEAIVRRCLEKNPTQRYHSARELAEALARLRRPRWGRWLAAALVAAAVLGVTAWAVLPDTDPERRYARAVAPKLAEIARSQGEPVELIPAGQGLPPYRVRCGDSDARKVWRSPEGVSILSTSVTILEFLPRVPADAYRIVMEVRHDHNTWRNTGPAGVGAVFSYTGLATPAGAHHFVGVFSFDDWGADHAGKQFARTGTALLKLLWYLDGPSENAVVPFKLSQLYPARYKHSYGNPHATPEFKTLTLTVEPGTIRGYWGREEAPELGPVRPKNYATLATVLKDGHPECANLVLPPLERPCVGVLVSGSTCTIRRLSIQPLFRN